MDILRPEYHPAQDAAYGGSSLRPLQNSPTYDQREHYALTVQPFRAGGYEATLRLVDLQAAADRAEMPRQYGPRVEGDERSQDSVDSSRQRAKATVRKRVKDMGGNRLCTLTARQSDALGYLSPEEWGMAFARYVRILRRAGLMSDYVAILEPHKKGLERLRARTDGARPAAPASWDIPLHIHFVTRSDFKMPINLMRKCWNLALGGRDGNIDVQWLRVRDGSDSIDRVAAYATKYITKGLAEFERFNKKRYWCAGLPLLAKGRTWLKGKELHEVWQQVLERLGLSDEMVMELIRFGGLFSFPDGRGMWFNVRHSGAAPPPF